ncbi:Ionotropic receptor 185, partial [Diabrotica virgifera virgifera]
TLYITDNNTIDGTEKVLLEETLHDQVNYSIYSYDTTDGSMWFNTIPEVEAGTKDICGCSRWPLNAYNRNLELTKSTHQICVTFLVKKPTLYPDILFVYYTFRSVVSWPTVGLFVFCSIFLWLAEKIFRSLKYFRRQFNDVTRYFLDLLHIFTGAGVNLQVVYHLYSAKFLLTVWFYTCLVCSTFYAAAVTSTTARPPITNVVNNLQDMVRLNIPWKLTNVVPKKEFLLTNSTLYTKLANLHVYGRRIEDRSQHSAIFVTMVENQYVVDIVTLPEEAKQYYKVIKQCVATHGSVFFVKKDTPLTKLIDKTIIKFVESGIANHILFKYLHLYGSGSQATFFTNYIENRFFRIIGMSKLVGAFILLATGLLASFFVFLFEIRMYKIDHNRELKSWF